MKTSSKIIILVALLVVAAGATMLMLPHFKTPADSSSQTASAKSEDVCPGTRVNLTTVGFSPYVRLKVDGKEGWFLIDSGASYSTIDSRIVHKASAGQFAELRMEGFPYVDREVFFERNLNSFSSPRGEGLLGMIGDNILSLVSVQFQYDADSAHIVVSPNACSPKPEENPDFVEIKQTGYYTRDRLHLKQGESDLPRLYVKIGSVSSPVYLDSGNGDGAMLRPTGALMMNSAFIDALRRTNIQMDQEEVNESVACPTQIQYRMQVRWKVHNQPLEITNADGNVLFRFAAPTIESIPPECSDIFSSQRPLGLIGASYLQRWGTVVIDAPGERVWIRKIAEETTPKLPRLDADWRPDSGVAQYVNPYGGRYDGCFLNGIFEGQGFYTRNNGDNYVGNFHNGLFEGQGKLWFKMGDYYEGNFHNGQPEGQGEMQYAKGLAYSDYQGNFHKGLPEGQGTLTYANHDTYTGEFHNGLPNGYGTYTRATDGYQYHGLFRDGRAVAPQ